MKHVKRVLSGWGRIMKGETTGSGSGKRYGIHKSKSNQSINTDQDRYRVRRRR